MNSPDEKLLRNAAQQNSGRRLSPRRSMHALEPRIVFDGAVAAALTDPNHPVVDTSAKAALLPADHARAVLPVPPVPVTQIVFVESNVANYQGMLKDFNLTPGTEVHVLDANKDGLTQMAQIMAGRSGIAAIQIVSHGSEATVQLGTLNLNAQTLNTRAADIATISSALTKNADILLYGCDVAKGSDGAAFVQALAQDTHAVVAASTDLTGAASKGGNWTLEYTTGVLDVAALHDYSYRDTLVNASYTDFTAATFSAAAAPNTATSAAVSGEQLKIASTAGQLALSINGGMNSQIASISGTGASLSTGADFATLESKLTFSVVGNKTFDLTSIMVADTFGAVTNTASTTFTLNFTGYKGAVSQGSTSITLTRNTSTPSAVAVTYNVAAPDAAKFQQIDSFTITATDANQNNGANLFVIAFDNVALQNITTPVAAPTTTAIVPNNGLSADTGSSATDWITQTAAQTISGTTSAALVTGEAIQVSYDNGTTWTTTGVTSTVGSSSWTATTTLAGSSTFQARVYNSGGSSTAATHTYVLDQVAPTNTFSSTITTNTGAAGSISSGGITKDNTLGLAGTYSDANGVTSVQIYDGATLLGTATLNAGAWSYTTATLADGSHSFTAVATDTAGNTTTTAAVTATVDTAAPTSTFSGTITTNTGSAGTISSGGLTKDNTLGLTGTYSDANSVGSVQIYDGATLLGSATLSAGTWTYTTGVLADGAHSFTAVATDTAGNTTTSTPAVTATVDTAAPALTGAVHIASNNATNTLAKTGNIITVSFTTDGTQSGTPTVTIAGQTATVTNTSGNNYTATYTMAGTETAGAVSFAINMTDAAGNAMTAVTATTDSSAVNFDKTAPTITSIALNASTYKLGDTVTVTVNTSVYDGNGTYTLSASTLDGTSLGSWSYTTGTNSGTASFVVGAGTTEVINGNVAVNIVVSDAAGNTSAAYTTALTSKTINTHAPTAVSVGGFSGTTTLTGNCPIAAGSTVGTLTTTDASSGDTFTYTLGGTDAAKFQVVSGVLKVAGGITLVNNTVYNITIQTTDSGGNTLGSAQAVQITGLDAPSVSSINRAGGSATTNATSETFTVTFSAAVTGVSASNFTRSGTDGTGTIGTPTTSDGGTTWSVTISSVSGNGTLGLDLTSTTGITAVTGGAALAGTHASDQTYTIDNTAPALTAVTIASNNTTSTVAKTGDVVTVSFTTDGTQSGTPTATIAGQTATVTNTGGNNFTATYTMQASDTSGTVAFAINVSDAVGNAMTAVTAVTSGSGVTFDRTAPASSTITAANLSAPTASTFTFTVAYTDTGGSGIKASSIGTGNVTVTGPGSIGALTVTGASWNAGSGVATYTVQAPHSGAWSSATDAGTYTINLVANQVTDLAGNAVASASGAATFTTAFVPTSTASITGLSADTGSSATDWITKTAAQTISGTTSAVLVTGEYIEVSYDNGTSWTTTGVTSTVGSSNWTATTTLAGSNTFQARVSNGGSSSTAASLVMCWMLLRRGLAARLPVRR